MLPQRRHKFLSNVTDFSGFAIFVTCDKFKFAAENRVNFQRRDWTGVKWSSQSRKRNFLSLPDLAFGFVHKRSGNEIIAQQQELWTRNGNPFAHKSLFFALEYDRMVLIAGFQSFLCLSVLTGHLVSQISRNRSFDTIRATLQGLRISRRDNVASGITSPNCFDF